MPVKAVLGLEDGTILEGRGFGHETEVTGEVVFNTGMVGYCESLTDPSYFGQILVQTYPLIGVYGVPSRNLTNVFKIPLHFESDRIHVTGYCISELQTTPSHWACSRTLNDWLAEQKIPAIEGIDTRELTKKLRMNGTMLGILKVADEIDLEEMKQKLKNIQYPNKSDLVKGVTVEKPVVYGDGETTVVVIDCGCKFGILRNLLARNVKVVTVPYNYPKEKILELNPAGVVISNGPGDPKKCIDTIQATKEFLETSIPIMGICLGNQILALAAGADTYKLKFGHRGANHPCMDVKTKRCYITTQNHGYAVEPKSLENTDLKISYVNINDKTVEGIKHRTKPIFSIQWHPEGSPGPYETGFLFDEFIKNVQAMKFKHW